MNNVASVKAKLKSRSIESGKTMQEMLIMYGLERTIYRLSISKYLENFTLKGGVFLYALFEGDYSRMTTDIDFLANRIINGVDEIYDVFAEIFAIQTNDPLRFDLDSLTATPIIELRKYHGVRVSITAYLDKTRIPISIDVGFGDVIYPERIKIDFPVILSDECPQVYSYSISSSVAEKFEAIVSLGYDNSRFKDYYDIYMLAISFDFDSIELTEAVKETFMNRGTVYEEVAAFEKEFAHDPLRQTRWNSFVKKKRTMLQVSLEETIETIQAFMNPILANLKQSSSEKQRWIHEERQWISKS